MKLEPDPDNPRRAVVSVNAVEAAALQKRLLPKKWGDFLVFHSLNYRTYRGLLEAQSSDEESNISLSNRQLKRYYGKLAFGEFALKKDVEVIMPMLDSIDDYLGADRT
ncbi:MAG: hypothetical protein ACREGG_03775 [Candidatus Saccharimonadales bacterium]